MSKLAITLLIGLAAATIDVLPMVLRRDGANPAEWTIIASAFTHWVVTTIFISYAVMPLTPWLKGALIGALSAAPVLITYSQTKPASVLPILGISVVLGAAVGFMTARFAG
jgi:hypothetical protein